MIQKKDGKTEIRSGNPYECLKEYFSEFHVTKEDGELAFIGGLVGSLGCDFIRYTEVLPDNNKDEIGIETIQFILATEFIVIDHVAETMSGVVLAEDSAEGKKEAMDGYQGEKKEEFVQDGVIVNKSDSLEQYGEKVEKIKKYIKEGHIFQTVLLHSMETWIFVLPSVP